jgi:hypothetical protein
MTDFIYFFRNYLRRSLSTVAEGKRGAANCGGATLRGLNGEVIYPSLLKYTNKKYLILTSHSSSFSSCNKLAACSTFRLATTQYRSRAVNLKLVYSRVLAANSSGMLCPLSISAIISINPI